MRSATCGHAQAASQCGKPACPHALMAWRASAPPAPSTSAFNPAVLNSGLYGRISCAPRLDGTSMVQRARYSAGVATAVAASEATTTAESGTSQVQRDADPAHASSFVYTRFHWPAELGGKEVSVWGEWGYTTNTPPRIPMQPTHGPSTTCPTLITQ